MKAHINGIDLAYDDLGSGPAVLLIHGFPLCRQMWAPQAEALVAAGYRVILPDLRGFGASEAPSGAYSLATFADDLVGLLDHLGLDQAVVGGMSMGGYVLLTLLQRHPGRVQAACFIVTRADADDEAGRAKRNHLIAEIEAGRKGAVGAAFGPLVFAEATLQNDPALVAEVRAWMDATAAAGLIGGLTAIRDRRDATPALAAMALPALVIGATADRAISADFSRKIAAGLPMSRLEILDGGGHMINREQAAAFNACLLDFLRTLPR